MAGRLFKLLLLLTILPVCSCRAETAAIDIQEIEVVLNPEKRQISGESKVVLSSGTEAVFAVAPAMTISGVIVGEKEARHGRTGDVVRVPLPATGGTVTISFSCTFPGSIPQNIVATEDPSFGVTAVIAPEGIFLGGGSGWYPEPDVIPRRRRITVHAPPGMKAVTAGRLVSLKESEKETVTIWETDRPLTHLSLSAGRYVVIEGKSTPAPHSVWVFPEDKDLAENYLASTARYLGFYSELLGPYPFEKFDVVENFLPTGYGFPSYTLIGGSVMRLPFIASTSLPHEIVHSWWGNGVLVDYSRGNWSEGLTAYLADYLLEERKSPAAGRSHRLKLLSDYATLVAPDTDFPLSRFLSRTDAASRSIGYGKGAMIFHMTRKKIGDEAFFKTLRRVAKEKMFRVTSWDDFAAAFAASGNAEAAALFRELVELKGGLRVGAAEVQLRKTGKGWEVVGKVRQFPLRAKVPVTLALEGGGGRTREQVEVGAAPVAFRIFSVQKPERLIVDPEVDLFRDLSPEEVPYTVNRIKGSKDLVAVITDSCRIDASLMKLLLKSLGREDVPVVPETELATRHTRDLLVCGIPAPKYLPEVRGVTADAGSFVVDGKTFSSPDDLLFSVGGRRDRSGATALFLPLSRKAGERGLKKITHYGGYGYLVFSDGTNVAKGTAEPPRGPGVVELSEM